jgi:hypothetical protein
MPQKDFRENLMKIILHNYNLFRDEAFKKSKETLAAKNEIEKLTSWKMSA